MPQAFVAKHRLIGGTFEHISVSVAAFSRKRLHGAHMKLLQHVGRDAKLSPPEHVERLRKLIGKDNSYTTYQKFNTCKGHFQAFLKAKYKVSDMSVKQLNPQMVDDFSVFLRVDLNIAHNTSIKFMQNFKRITALCMRNGWIVRDPFTGIKLSLKEVDRPYLNEEELRRVIAYHSPIDRLNRVRDFFLFACFTGLAYADVKKLKRSEIETDGANYWIRTRRQKTGGRSNIPLLEVPMAIIRRYAALEETHDSDTIVPIISNQKMNSYLKEIADSCGISKQLTFHVARHTFATTVTLTNGVPIETVSKMLGHKDLRSTQHYARIVDQKVGDEMAALADKLRHKSLTATN
jgi:integrase